MSRLKLHTSTGNYVVWVLKYYVMDSQIFFQIFSTDVLSNHPSN